MAFNQTYYYLPTTTGESASDQHLVFPVELIVDEQPPSLREQHSTPNAVHVYHKPPQQQYTVHPGIQQQFLAYEQPPGLQEQPTTSNVVQIEKGQLYIIHGVVRGGFEVSDDAYPSCAPTVRYNQA
ncbi:hypothetical protein Y032_0102g3490 [Ancylostoma ceylanicum]|uniref:Uncharacterized protein n=1 Tax=Ancylostoma ceylanicum TaxID=53326 RepID=A0A016THP8_9BILA|nr:hypothetical protein Y032_0102g3490 [Ancylostoma ceylanicum]